MPRADDSVQTRQRAEPLFDTHEPLSPPDTFVSEIRNVAGFDSVAILGVSDAAFSVQIEEACLLDGEYVVTETLTSAPTPDGLEAICERIQPCGTYMRITVTPAGAQGELGFCVYGVPAP